MFGQVSRHLLEFERAVKDEGHAGVRDSVTLAFVHICMCGLGAEAETHRLLVYSIGELLL